MKFSPNISVMIPVITVKNLILMQLISFNESRAANFWSHCLAALAFMTLTFFLIEWMWFVFRSKIIKANSAYPFWRKFLSQVLTNVKAVNIALAWLMFVAFTFASIAWGADFLTDESVAHFGFYLTLSLLLNFYLATLFSVWHLFLAPRLASLSQTKGLHSSQ